MVADGGLNGTNGRSNGNVPLMYLNGASTNDSLWAAPPRAVDPGVAIQPIWPDSQGPWPTAVPDEFEIERAALESQIAAAKARAATALHREPTLCAALRDEVTTSQRQLAEIETAHERAVARVRDEAAAEVARILADARALSAARTVDAVGPESADISGTVSHG
jgi:hypothetical protein